MGRPSKFKAEYGEMLIKHMREGGSIESFGALIQCSKQTIYNWFDNHEEFLDARKTGEPGLYHFYENMGKMIATGQLRRVKSETAVLDNNGKVQFDKEGRPVMNREYEATTGNSTAWIFLTKNLLNWRDKRDVELTGKDGGPMEFSNISNEELKGRIDALIQKRNAGKK